VNDAFEQLHVDLPRVNAATQAVLARAKARLLAQKD